MMVVMQGNVKVRIGASTSAYMEITNVKRLVYRWQPTTYTPQTVMRTTNPVGFNRPHKYIIGELHTLSECHDAFYNNTSFTPPKQFIKPDGDNEEIPYFEAFNTDSEGREWKYTFYGVVPVDDPFEAEDGKDIVHVYPFVAKKVVVTKPT